MNKDLTNFSQLTFWGLWPVADIHRPSMPTEDVIVKNLTKWILLKSAGCEISFNAELSSENKKREREKSVIRIPF